MPLVISSLLSRLRWHEANAWTAPPGSTPNATPNATPVGTLDSVVALQSRLSHGTTLQQLMTLAGSLGHKDEALDNWSWSDQRGNHIVVTVRRGVVVRWAVRGCESQDSARSLSAA